MIIEEGARLMYEDLKVKMLPRLELAKLERASRFAESSLALVQC